MPKRQFETDQTSLAPGMKPREPRRNVVIPARMRCGGAWTDVCIRNMSSRGLLLQSATPPRRGTYVEILKGRHGIVGRVAWAKDRRFGIHSQNRIDIEAIIGEARGAEAISQPAGGERRFVARKTAAASAAERLERSRRLSAAFQFVCIVLCGAAVAMIIADTVRDTLSRPMKAVSAGLGDVS